MPSYDHVPAAKIFVCSILINLTSFYMTFFFNIDQDFYLLITIFFHDIFFKHRPRISLKWSVTPHNKKLFKQEI